MINKGYLDQIVASNLREEISPDSLKSFVEVAERCLLDEPKYRPTMSQIVLQLESALEQHDSKEQTDICSVVNNVYLADEDIFSSENTKGLTVTSPAEATDITEIFNERLELYSPADEGDSGKQKTYSPLRFWARNAAWNRIKPSKRYILASLISEIRGSYIKLPRFDLTIIATATNQFSHSQKIGDGVSFTVYKAVLPTGLTVAVRRYSLNVPSTLYALEGFKNEIFVCSSLNHRNVTNLLGYCIHENGEAILVYEYMEQGTLYYHLHNWGNSQLTWKQRLQICIDAAKGLEYLHTGSDNPIIHRKVKSANILLDKKWMAKVSNFSVSKAWPPGEGDIDARTMRVRGTLGYLDPGYMQTSHELTEKSDVYSYGVVLFEVLCGRPATIYSSEVEGLIFLATWATSCFKEGKLEEIINSNLNGQIAPECLRRFSETAIACLNDRGSNRPAMRDVVRNLELAMEREQLMMVAASYI